MFGEGAEILQCLLADWELHVSFENSLSGQELKLGLLAPLSRAGGPCALRAFLGVQCLSQRSETHKHPGVNGLCLCPLLPKSDLPVPVGMCVFVFSGALWFPDFSGIQVPEQVPVSIFTAF